MRDYKIDLTIPSEEVLSKRKEIQAGVLGLGLAILGIVGYELGKNHLIANNVAPSNISRYIINSGLENIGIKSSELSQLEQTLSQCSQVGDEIDLEVVGEIETQLVQDTPLRRQRLPGQLQYSGITDMSEYGDPDHPCTRLGTEFIEYGISRKMPWGI